MIVIDKTKKGFYNHTTWHQIVLIYVQELEYLL